MRLQNLVLLEVPEAEASAKVLHQLLRGVVESLSVNKCEEKGLNVHVIDRPLVFEDLLEGVLFEFVEPAERHAAEVILDPLFNQIGHLVKYLFLLYTLLLIRQGFFAIMKGVIGVLLLIVQDIVIDIKVLIILVLFFFIFADLVHAPYNICHEKFLSEKGYEDHAKSEEGFLEPTDVGEEGQEILHTSIVDIVGAIETQVDMH